MMDVWFPSLESSLLFGTFLKDIYSDSNMRSRFEND
jgi:hypothetical protein